MTPTYFAPGYWGPRRPDPRPTLDQAEAELLKAQAAIAAALAAVRAARGGAKPGRPPGRDPLPMDKAQ